MPDTIETWRIQAFSDNVHHLTQQKTAKFAPWCRMATNLTGKVKYFDRISGADMVVQSVRNGDTQWINSEHSRRGTFKVNYVWARPVDEEDQLETIDNITNELAIAASFAVNRRFDQTWANAISGSAAQGEDGSTLVPLPAAQKETTATGNTLAKLVASIKKLNDADVDVIPSEVLYAHSPASLEDLLNISATFTSRDFNPAMALMTGQINSYLGMTWVMSNRLPIVSGANVRGTYLAHRNAVGFAEWVKVKSSLDKRPDKNNLLQILVKTMHGAVRVEDQLVVENQVTE
jgi:hypothetical protein